MSKGDRFIVKSTDLAIDNSNIDVDNNFKSDIDNRGYNPNRDPDGRFGVGTGGYSTKYSRMAPIEYGEKIQKDYGDQATWTEQQKDEIADYCDMSFDYTNTALREARGDIKKLDDYRKQTVKLLDSSMKNTLKENTILYRGIVSNREIYKGDRIDHYGYSSTSFFKQKGESFAISEAEFGGGNKTPYLLTIKAKKGQKGVITRLASSRTSGLRDVEAEFLLPRNLKLEVVDRKETMQYIELITEIK